jgi:glycosyltransferase involved in cell wall biosynthesis
VRKGICLGMFGQLQQITGSTLDLRRREPGHRYKAMIKAQTVRFPQYPLCRPRVSVAVASYNYGRYLRECIESALNQNDVEVEVVVVDDGSSDDSVAIATELSAADSRVRLITHRENRGHISTFNEVLWAAEGEFIVKLDSDDVLTPGALARAAGLMTAFPRLGLVYGNPLTFTDSPPPPARTRPRSASLWSGTDWLALRCKRATNCIRQPEAMLRTSVLRRTDGHRHHLPATHDLNLWLRIAAISDVGRVNGADQGYYRVHSDSLLQSRYGSYYADLVERRKAFDDFFKSLASEAVGSNPAALLRNQTSRTLAKQSLSWACREIDRSEANDKVIGDYVSFALDVYPRTRDLPQWQALHRRLEGKAISKPGRLTSNAADIRRGLHDRLVWRRWRRFGT